MTPKQGFAPNDPFKPSIQYGVNQIGTQIPDENDLYTPPKLLRLSQRHAPMRSGAAEAWDGGWGTEGWGRSHDDSAYPSRPDWVRLNVRKGKNKKQDLPEELDDWYGQDAPEAPPQARPAWRTVRVPRRKGKRSWGSPERNPAQEATETPTWMPLDPSQQRHTTPESPIRATSPQWYQRYTSAESPFRPPSPHLWRQNPSYAPSSYQRGRRSYPRPHSESFYSSRSPESPSPQRHQRPPRSWAPSPPAGAQFELAAPRTSAPLAVIAESIPSSHRSPLPFRHPNPTKTPRVQAYESDIQIDPSVTETSDRQSPRERVRSPRVFVPVDDDGGPHSIPLSHLPIPSPRTASPLSSQAQKMDWNEVSSIASCAMIDDAPATFVTEPHISTQTYVKAFVLDTLPRQIYTYALLRLPHMYFSRVTRIFEEAELSIPQIKEGIVEAFIKTKNPSPQSAWMEPPVEGAAYSTLASTWEGFIDSVLREWKTLNIISVLLLSAILTMLQLEGAGTDPLTRFTALLSMVCALMSLLYGCMFIIRFGTMRKTYKAAEWANEVQRSRTGIFWNVWVLLAMPATWLAWSMILYIISIMSFIWRTGTASDANRGDFTARQALAGRITVSVTLALGLVYFFLILGSLRRYGYAMDRAWQQRINGWITDQIPQETPEKHFSKPVYVNVPAPTHSWATWMPDPKLPPSSAGDGTEKIDLADQVPSEHLEHGFARSLSTNRNDFTNNWLVGQYDLGSELSLPNSQNPFASGIDVPPTAPQFHDGIPSVSDHHVTHSSDFAPEIRPTRPLLRPASPLQITVNAGNGSDTEAVLTAYNTPNQFSDTVDIIIKPFGQVEDTKVSFNESWNSNMMKIAQHGSNLVYMGKVVCLQDTSAGVNVFPCAHSVIDRTTLKFLPYHGELAPDFWKELERDIRLSWTPDNFSPMHQVLQKWNSTKLRPQNIQMALCQEVQTSGAESLSVYSLSLSYPLQMIDKGAFVLPPYLRTLEIFTQPLLKDDSVPEIIKIEWDCQGWVERDTID